MPTPTGPTHTDDDRAPVPALRYHWLTSLYDPVVRVTTRERTFRKLLVEEAGVRAGERVLDLGCGTGTLLALLHQTTPSAQLHGVDADSQVLGLARRKLSAAGVTAELSEALASDTGYEAASFDCIVSSLFFHHLTTEQKYATLAHARHLLRPEGRVVIADWGRPHNLLMRAAFLAVQVLDGFEITADNVAGRLPELMTQAGFRDVAEQHRVMTPLGSISLYCGAAAQDT
jgi:cyclopropane fatty-acyl-phospholipid synthase-like methyltransferase